VLLVFDFLSMLRRIDIIFTERDLLVDAADDPLCLSFSLAGTHEVVCTVSTWLITPKYYVENDATIRESPSRGALSLSMPSFNAQKMFSSFLQGSGIYRYPYDMHEIHPEGGVVVSLRLQFIRCSGGKIESRRECFIGV
jgi:hypothetical protein